MEKKLEDNLLAEEVRMIAETDLELAQKIAESIQDSEAKVMAFLNLYLVSKKQEFLDQALNSAKSDSDYLRIVEISGLDFVGFIKDPYRRDIAYASLFERTCDLKYSEKICDKKIASASMKRVSEKLSFPENLRIARSIPDAYYRCLALIEISEKEKLDLRAEILESLNAIENIWLRKWLEARLRANSKL